MNHNQKQQKKYSEDSVANSIDLEAEQNNLNTQSNTLVQMYHKKQNLSKSLRDIISNEMRQENNTHILIICTGGTISMVPSEQGLIVKKGAMEKYITQNLFFCDINYTKKYDCGFYISPKSVYGKRAYYKFLEFDQPIDSSNMTPDQYIQIGDIVNQNYDKYDAFIILHGTDTMAYTASTLSFLFENLGKTVIITGSMIPMSEPGNDAFNNFLSALTLAAHYDIPEVTIFMADKLMRGNRTVKNSSEKLDAFDSPNYQPLAVLTSSFKFNKQILLTKPTVNFRFHNKIETKIASVQITPYVDIHILEALFEKSTIKGIILQTYGAGNIPSNNLQLVNLIKNASKRGVIIVNISQTYHTNVSAIYNTGLVLKQIGVIFANDMIFEAALGKLSYILTLDDLNLEQKKQKFSENLRGEVTLEEEQKILKSQEVIADQKVLASRTLNLVQVQQSEEENKIDIEDYQDENQVVFQEMKINEIRINSNVSNKNQKQINIQNNNTDDDNNNNSSTAEKIQTNKNISNENVNIFQAETNQNSKTTNNSDQQEGEQIQQQNSFFQNIPNYISKLKFWDKKTEK